MYFFITSNWKGFSCRNGICNKHCVAGNVMKGSFAVLFVIYFGNRKFLLASSQHEKLHSSEQVICHFIFVSETKERVAAGASRWHCKCTTSPEKSKENPGTYTTTFQLDRNFLLSALNPLWMVNSSFFEALKAMMFLCSRSSAPFKDEWKQHLTIRSVETDVDIGTLQTKLDLGRLSVSEAHTVTIFLGSSCNLCYHCVTFSSLVMPS